jgi:hypothetical protein
VEASSTDKKETLMNPYIHTQIEMASSSETITQDEKELLAQWGFTDEEVTSLLWLRQWYQTGGSDRAAIVRHLEFLRLLVLSGELEF